MMDMPYTWTEWRERFLKTCREENYNGPIDFDSFVWDYEQGEDPQTVAMAFVAEMNEER